MKCSTCGTENDPANRFCDQCGSRLEPSGGFAQAQVAAAQQPVAVGPICPSCGATVLPGEAFCDECGTSLSGVAPVAAAYDAPTMYSPPPDSGAPAADQSSICQACGHQNLPGDRFCDNCGSALAPAQASSPSITEAPTVAAGGGLAEAPTVTADADLLRELNAAQPAPTGADAQVPTPERPADAQADAQAPTQERPVAVPPAPDEAPSPDKAPTQEQLALDSSAAQSAYEAERQRLEEEITRQQQIIAQLEQMETMFGAATPPAVRQGLTEARDAKARTEAELAALQPPPPPVDPAEVARLEEEIARQQQIIAQLEQMETMFGAATPPAVRQGLTEARDAKARAEAELAALGTGAAAPSVVAAPPEAPAAPVSAPVEQPAVAQAPTALPVQPPPPVVAPPVNQPAPADAPTELAPPPEAAPPQPVAPPPAPAPAPRLVVDETGKELAFPLDKREIIVGREDPISGIFPEIDLTAHGGETGGVSRQHARISRADGQWVIIDLNSTNYTRVNGNKINPSTPVPITNGAKIQFGRVALTFRE